MMPVPDSEIPGATPLDKIGWLVDAAMEEEDGVGLHLEAIQRQLDVIHKQPDDKRHVSIMPAAQLYVCETHYDRDAIRRCRELTTEHRMRDDETGFEDAVFVHFALGGTVGDHIAIAFDCSDVYKDGT